MSPVSRSGRARRAPASGTFVRACATLARAVARLAAFSLVPLSLNLTVLPTTTATPTPAARQIIRSAPLPPPVPMLRPTGTASDHPPRPSALRRPRLGTRARIPSKTDPPVDATPAPVLTARFGWPLRPRPTISRAFQPPSQPYGPGHRGVDLAGSPGQPVLASGDGVVIYAGRLADRGVVSIEHGNSLRTSYEPVRATVRTGQIVHFGDEIGRLAPGHEGCAFAACLHWGLRKDGGYLDPLVLVRTGHVRLLPWHRTMRADESGRTEG